MNGFAPSVFRPRFMRYVARRIKASPASQQAAVWELLAQEPEFVQERVERAWMDTLASPHEAGRSLPSLAELFAWLAQNWELILRLLLSLIPLIIQEGTEDDGELP